MIKKFFKIIFSLAGILFLIFLFLISAPPNFPINKIVAVEKGTASEQVAQNFYKEGFIRYPLLFNGLIRCTGNEKNIKAGKYMFAKPLSLVGLVGRLASGAYGIPSVKITIPEGSTIKDINDIFSKMGFADFAIKNKELEGYLFPDTYLFLMDASPEEAVAAMTGNLKNQTAGLEDAISKSKRGFHQILTMASLLEKEAANPEDRKIISGILWKRFDKKMPLQVDAAFVYAINKNTYELTTEDLKADSPYNTYLRVGLPPTPISNPGLDAIIAAVFPEKTPYWFYLSDKSGKIYYSKTFEEHIVKKQKYL